MNRIDGNGMFNRMNELKDETGFELRTAENQKLLEG